MSTLTTLGTPSYVRPNPLGKMEYLKRWPLVAIVAHLYERLADLPENQTKFIIGGAAIGAAYHGGVILILSEIFEVCVPSLLTTATIGGALGGAIVGVVFPQEVL